jgi:hypothetical protein
MLQAFRKGIAPFLAVLAAAAIQAPSAQAGFSISVSEDGGPVINIADGGPLDQDGVANGVINVITDAGLGGLNSFLLNFNFGGLSATESNGTSGSNDVAFVRQTGDVARTDVDALSHYLTITAEETAFNYPTGPVKSMVTSASDTFGNTVAGDNRTFQSLFNGTNSSSLLSFSPPAGQLTYSTSDPGITTALGIQPTPFSLSNTTVITLGPSGALGPASDQFTGKTAVTGQAIPEPSSAVLGLISLPALLALGRRMRRRVDA